MRLVETKQELLHQALNLFSSMGYEACGVQEICDKAGVTKPTLYHHYGNKRGLLNALVQSLYNPLLQELEPAFQYRGDLTGTLEKIARVFFTYAGKFPREFRLYLTLGLSPRESQSRLAILNVQQWMAEKATELFINASADHGNMKGRQLLLTAGFIGMIHTFGSLIADGQVALSDQLVYKAVHQYSHGIYS